MARASTFDLVSYLVYFYSLGQHIGATALALVGCHFHGAGVQRSRQHTNAASGFGLGIPPVLVAFFLCKLASLGLALALAGSLAYLSSSLLA